MAGRKKGIDWSFISAREGGAQRKGYVPVSGSGEVIGKSGLTIATGWDVGQMSEDELRSSGLSESIINKVLPFAGSKKGEALKLLKKHGAPRITSEEASEIDMYTHGKTLTSLKEKYNEATGRDFEDLSPGKQTVVASVAFQYGSNLEKRTPGFWKQVTSGDWQGAVGNLEDFGDKYPSRRNLEAALLKSDLASANIAFAARDEIKKNASNIAFENMERVNKKSDVNIASYKETEAEKVQREMEELMSRGRAESISKRERK